jgi:hypothetical protein
MPGRAQTVPPAARTPVASAAKEDPLRLTPFEVTAGSDVR